VFQGTRGGVLRYGNFNRRTSTPRQSPSVSRGSRRAAYGLLAERLQTILRMCLEDILWTVNVLRTFCGLFAD